MNTELDLWSLVVVKRVQENDEEVRTIIEIVTPHAQYYDDFFGISEHTTRGMTAYAEFFNFMVGIYLHDCKESDMVGLFDGNSHGLS